MHRRTLLMSALAIGKAPFWVKGDLAISAFEQVAFLQRLYRNELPFEVTHVMVNKTSADWTCASRPIGAAG
jgi:beta-lactamase class D